LRLYARAVKNTPIGPALVFTLGSSLFGSVSGRQAASSVEERLQALKDQVHALTARNPSFKP